MWAKSTQCDLNNSVQVVSKTNDNPSVEKLNIIDNSGMFYYTIDIQSGQVEDYLVNDIIDLNLSTNYTSLRS